MAPILQENLTVGTRVTIAADAEVRGSVSIGSGTVIHPRATILALSGPISLGSNNILEEAAVIVNRTGLPIRIGDDNLFHVGCRIEAASVGSSNTFGVKCKVAHTVSVGSWCSIGAGTTVAGGGEVEGVFEEEEVVESLPDRTVTFGNEGRRRLWSGEGARQQAALHAKHLEYLREAIPKTHQLKIVHQSSE